ncbi:MAG: glycosyltransferase family 2 protein [Chitinophagales bacterium]
MAIEKSKILVLLPAFNEASVIRSVIQGIRNVGYPNVCVVNDGSSDDTLLNALHSGAIVLSHCINRGAGAAAQTGIAYANKHHFPFIIMMDSDGQHLVEDIEKLCFAMENTMADIVIGNRFALQSNAIPNQRIVYNSLANIFTNLFCSKKYSDTQSGFRLLNRKAIENLQLKNRGFGYCSEMLIEAEKNGLQIAETPIQVIYNEYSMSKGQNLFVGFKTAANILWRIVFN